MTVIFLHFKTLSTQISFVNFYYESKTSISYYHFKFSKTFIQAQASWSYSVWFNIEDEKGELMGKDDLIKKGIKLLTFSIGSHTDNEFEYDTLNNSFKFSQHTITSSSIIVFIQGRDTTTFEIGTDYLYFDKIILTGEDFQIRVWNNEFNFLCEEKLHGYERYGNICKNKFPIENYRMEREEKVKRRKLVEVKLK